MAGQAASISPSSSGWSWDGANLSQVRTALSHPANFGASGTVSTTVQTLALSAVNATTLSGLDVFVSSWWRTNESAPYEAAIVDFFLSGGSLLLLDDSPGRDGVARRLGVPTVGSSNGTPSVGEGDLFEGPFGSADGALQSGATGFLNAADVIAQNGTVGGRNAAGQVTAAFWRPGEYAPGAGALVILADVDMVSNFNAVYTSPRNANGRLGLNTFAFLLGSMPQCPAGTAPDAGGTCVACPAGTFSPAAGGSACQACPAGSFADAEGSVTCRPCAVGTFADTTGNATCLACAAGTFSSLEGSISCTPCAAGSFSASAGIASCDLCPAGRFSEVEGSVECAACPVGEFADSPGSVSCEACGTGTFANAEGSTVCTACGANEVAPSGAAACTACGLNTEPDANRAQCAEIVDCILGTQSVRIADRGDVRGSIVSLGTTEIGADAGVDSVASVGNVTLRNRAFVQGDVTSESSISLQQGATVGGSITEFASVAPPNLPPISGPGVGHQNINVNSGQVVTLAPGAYGNVNLNSNATLVLDGIGEYGFARLNVNSGAVVEYASGAVIYVERQINWRGTQSGSGPLWVVQTGTGWSSFEGSFNGGFIGPQANVRYSGNGSPVVGGGAFVGRSISVEPGVALSCF